MKDDRYDIAQVEFPDTPFPLWSSTILLGKRGSESHGTYIAPTDPNAFDDRDLMGVCIPPVEYHFGLKTWEGVDAIKGPWDTVLYSAKKFVHLLTKQNPNVLCMLYLRNQDYIHLTPAGRSIIEKRKLFQARRPAFDSFGGYAKDQLNKMTANQPYQGYMGAKRKAFVDKFGYDCKNASHLIRLLHTGIEYLSTGHMAVFRPDKERTKLMDIKQGKWTLEDVKLHATELFGWLNYAHKYSVLPDEVDRDAASELLTDITFKHLGLSYLQR